MNEQDTYRYRLHAEVCKVLTDPKRLMIIDALADGERSVGELAAALGVTLANASQHLGVMRHAGLVETRRQGTTIVYRLGEPEIVEACRIIDRVIARRTHAGVREPSFGGAPEEFAAAPEELAAVPERLAAPPDPTHDRPVGDAVLVESARS